jgi:hypothetical protein
MKGNGLPYYSCAPHTKKNFKGIGLYTIVTLSTSSHPTPLDVKAFLILLFLTNGCGLSRNKVIAQFVSTR